LLGTRADWQSHLKLAVAELGVQGIRMHGVLDDDMSVAKCTDPSPNASFGSGCYSFYNVDRVYDFLLSIGVRPLVELSFMPKALAKCSDTCSPASAKNGTCIACSVQFGDGGSYKALAQIPADFEDWYNLVRKRHFAPFVLETIMLPRQARDKYRENSKKSGVFLQVNALAAHMVERHGLAEVSTWYWEVWSALPPLPLGPTVDLSAPTHVYMHVYVPHLIPHPRSCAARPCLVCRGNIAIAM